jgi:hypothetical protein
MTKAYLRGFLPPAAVHGFQSRLRETILFEALEMEEASSGMLASTMASLAVIGPSQMDSSSRQHLLTKINRRMELRSKYQALDLHGVRRQYAMTSELAARKIYDSLQRAGLVGQEDPDDYEDGD